MLSVFGAALLPASLWWGMSRHRPQGLQGSPVPWEIGWECSPCLVLVGHGPAQAPRPAREPCPMGNRMGRERGRSKALSKVGPLPVFGAASHCVTLCHTATRIGCGREAGQPQVRGLPCARRRES